MIPAERDDCSVEGGDPVGAIVLLRDVSDIRRRDRLLLSKDAMIREIHHRVKNNLQTVAALLRLQARRLGDDDETAREALTEAERRIGSVAVVHETLARAAEGVGDFDQGAARVAGQVGGPHHRSNWRGSRQTSHTRSTAASTSGARSGWPSSAHPWRRVPPCL